VLVTETVNVCAYPNKREWDQVGGAEAHIGSLEIDKWA